MKEREISLVNLLVEILLRWRIIVLWMLVGGLVFGGLSYVKSYRSVQAQRAQREEAQKQLDEKKTQEDLGDIDRKWLEEQLTETQIANVNSVVYYEKLYSDKMTYVKESVLMNIDPNAVPKAQLTFLIKAENTQQEYDIQKVYEDLAGSGSLFDWVAEQSGISTASLNEIVTLEKSSYSLLEGSNILRMAVVHNDQKVCQEIAGYIAEYIVGQRETLAPVLGEHDIIVLDQSVSVVSDTNLLTQQRNYYTDLLNLQSVPVKAKEAFSDEEWDYYNFITTGNIAGDGDDEGNEEENSGSESSILLKGQEIPEPGISMKYVIIGIILAAFLYTLVICMRYILSNKLKTGDDLQSLFDIPQLGRITKKESPKKIFASVDGWIQSLRDRNTRKFTTEEALNLAAVAVKIAVKKEGLKNVYLIGCNMKDGAENICEQIKEILKNEDMTIYVLDNVLYNAEALEKLSGAEGVALVESAGSTLYGEINNELELLRRQGIMVLGGIVVE